MDFKINIPNKYNLKISDIPNLIVDRTRITSKPFWRNNVINAWCLTGKAGGNNYWIGIYDEDAPQHAGKIRIYFTAYYDMCGYIFEEFYNPGCIENEDDFMIQEKFLKQINELIDNGVFAVPKSDIY